VDLGLITPAFDNSDGAFSAARYFLQLSSSDRSTLNVEIDGNDVGGSYDGIITLGNGVFDVVDITNNTIHDVVLGVRTQAGTNVPTGALSNFNIANNDISSSNRSIFLQSGSAGGGTADAYTNFTINNNSLIRSSTGATLEIDPAATVLDAPIDATCNWWGVAVYNDISGRIIGSTIFNPALLGGMDSSPAIGFQPADACGNTDFVAPDAVCQNITIYLDASGQALITDPEDLDGGSTDNAGIASFAVSMTNFDCNNLGDTNVTLTVTDINGNSASCNAVVTVVDDINPTITCAPDDIRYINQVNLTYAVSGTEFDPSAVNDNCGFTVSHNASAIMGAVSTGDFTTLAGWQLPVGLHTVTFTVTDGATNTATCEVVIEVLQPVLTGSTVINLNCTPRDVRIRVYQQNTSNLLFTYLSIMDANGDFETTLTGLAPGNYDFYIKVEGYLQRSLGTVAVSGSGPSLALSSLKPGDTAGGGPPNSNAGLNGSFNDNVINSADLSLILAHYNTLSTNPMYNSRTDLNCNGQVDALDLSFISFFYLNQGQQP
jgi:hypothetical protein